jgi:triacylglycerol esterase/lipase EstA (alpha/beta hydrolase family)
MSKTRTTFKDFIKAFPAIELPVVLDGNIHHTFSQENKPLRTDFIEEFILPYDKMEVDEFTEYVPCFRLPDQLHFHGVVYWRAALMDYNYVLITFDKKGECIQTYHIGGTKTDGMQLVQLLCTIHPNLKIDLAAGSNALSEEEYEPKETKVFHIQLLEDGTADIEMDETIWS